MKTYGKSKTVMNSATCLKVLERVARSSWGQQGIGKIPNKKHADLMLAVGCVKTTKDEGIYALTLKGLRFLEKLRWDKTHQGGEARSVSGHRVN